MMRHDELFESFYNSLFEAGIGEHIADSKKEQIEWSKELIEVAEMHAKAVRRHLKDRTD